MLKNILKSNRLILAGFIFLLLSVSLTNGAGYFLETRLLIYLVFLALFALWLIQKLLVSEFKPIIKTPLDGSLVFLLIAALVSMLKTGSLEASLDGFLLILVYCLAFWLVAGNVKTFGQAKGVGVSLLVSASLLSVYGIYQHLIGFEILRQYVEEEAVLERTSRVLATFTSPNVLASLLILTLPLAFAFLLEARYWWQKFLAGLAVVVMSNCFILTYSRGAYFSFFVVLVIVGFLLVKRNVGKLFTPRVKRKVLVSFLTLSLTVASTYVGLFFLGRLFSSTLAYEGLTPTAATTSFLGRFYFWQGAARIIKDSPVIGSGVGTFARKLPSYQIGSFYSKYAHNTYLEVFAEMGLVGCLALLTALFILIRKQIGGLLDRKESHQIFFKAALLVGCLGFLIHNFVDYGWYIPVTGVFFWTAAGLSMVWPTLGEEFSLREESRREVPRAAVFLSVVVTLALIAMVFLACQAEIYSLRGDYLSEHGRWRDSSSYFGRAVKFNPLSGRYRLKLAEAYFQRARQGERELISRAVEEGKKGVALEPIWAYHWARLGVFYWSQDEHGEAEELLEQGKKLAPNDPYFPLLKGDFYASLNRHQLAISEYQEATLLGKYYGEWLSDGRISSKIDRYSQAIWFNIIRAHLGLAQEWTKLKKYHSALAEYNKVIQLWPQGSVAYGGRGYIYQRQGRYEAAIKEYQKAIKLDPGKVEFYLDLGLLYEKMGQLKLARENFEKVLQLSPGHSAAQKALMRVKSKIR